MLTNQNMCKIFRKNDNTSKNFVFKILNVTPEIKKFNISEYVAFHVRINYTYYTYLITVT